jgi:hypothetical protein
VDVPDHVIARMRAAGEKSFGKVDLALEVFSDHPAAATV